MIRLLSALLLSALVLLLPVGIGAVAAGPGVIDGRLVQGTAGGGAVSGLPVTLLVFRGEQEQERLNATAGLDGAFRFDGLETSAGFTYQVVAPYASVEYGGTPIAFDPNETTKETELRLYETTEVDPGLRIEWAMVVLDQVDRASQTVSAFELLMLSNPSDRTFLPSTTGPAGPMGLLRFSLPRGAGQLAAAGPGLGENDLFQVDTGFATTNPVPPGRHELSFRYVFPYQGSSFAFERTAVYDSSELWVLVRDEGPTIVSDALQAEQPITLAGVTYRLQVARELPAGGRLSWAITDLPTRSLITLPFEAVPAQIWGGSAIAVALAIVLGYVLLNRKGQSVVVASSVDPATSLLHALATLDEERAAGRLSEEEHESRREALKAALREVYLADHRLPARAAADEA